MFKARMTVLSPVLGASGTDCAGSGLWKHFMFGYLGSHRVTY